MSLHCPVHSSFLLSSTRNLYTPLSAAMSAAVAVFPIGVPTGQPQTQQPLDSSQRSQQQRRKRDSATTGQPSQPHKQQRTPTQPSPQHQQYEQQYSSATPMGHHTAGDSNGQSRRQPQPRRANGDSAQQPQPSSQQAQPSIAAAQSQQNGGVDGGQGRGRGRRGRGGGKQPYEQNFAQQQAMEVDSQTAPSHPPPAQSQRQPPRAAMSSSASSARTQPSADSFIASVDTQFGGITFNDLGLLPSLLRAVTQVGYTAPTPIQQKAIPFALTGRDVLGCAQTGTGQYRLFRHSSLTDTLIVSCLVTCMCLCVCCARQGNRPPFACPYCRDCLWHHNRSHR